jgi:hypothetical protein
MRHLGDRKTDSFFAKSQTDGSHSLLRYCPERYALSRDIEPTGAKANTEDMKRQSKLFQGFPPVNHYRHYLHKQTDKIQRRL